MANSVGIDSPDWNEDFKRLEKDFLSAFASFAEKKAAVFKPDEFEKELSLRLQIINLSAAQNEHKYVVELDKQILQFRRIIFRVLVVLMVSETILLFLVLILSSLPSLNFIKVEPMTLQILVGATLTQISVMVIWIIKSVFPPRLHNIIKSSK